MHLSAKLIEPALKFMTEDQFELALKTYGQERFIHGLAFGIGGTLVAVAILALIDRLSREK